MATHPAPDSGDATTPSADLARPAETARVPGQLDEGLAGTADEHGITVQSLLDRIARTGRHHGLAIPVREQDDWEPAAGALRLPGWIVGPQMPEWLAQTQRPSNSPTSPVRWPLPGQAGGILVGPPRTGKTNQARQLRAALETSGIPFQERTLTNEHGQEHIELIVQRERPTALGAEDDVPDGSDRNTQFDGAGTKPAGPGRPR